MTRRRHRTLARLTALLLAVPALGALAQGLGLGSTGTPTAPAAAASAPGAQPAQATTVIVNAPAAQATAGSMPSADRSGDANPPRLRSDGTNAAGPGYGPAGIALRPPEPPNEFQRFVQASTGQTLPMFGERYFANTPQTFAPLDRVPVPADYVLGPGDELYVRAWGNVDIDYRATIDRNGQISMPHVGTFTVAGLKADDVEGHLRTQVGRLYKGFSLSVTLGQLRSIQIFVVGQASQPGTYTVGSMSTLVNAIFASGGPGSNGSMRRVELRRGSGVVAAMDLYEFIIQGNKASDVALQAGDVIVYTPAGPRVAVIGAVDTPAVYELKPGGSSLAEIVALAGGQRAQSSTRPLQLERIAPADVKAPRSVVNVEFDRAAQTALRDGDLIRVFPITPQFANAVTLRGSVAAPLRYPYTPGMRVSDLIPEREALITPDYYLRKNRLVQFTEPRRIDATALELSVGSLVDEVNWEYAAIERLDTDRLTTQLIPFKLGRAVIDHDPAEDQLLLPGDVVTVFSTKDIRAPQARSTRLVRLEGEVERPGVYQLQPGDTLRSLILRTGGFTPQAYVYGLEFSREETRQRQRENLAVAQARLESLLATQAARTAANRVDLASTSIGTTGSAAAVTSNAAAQAQISRLARIQPNGRIALELEPGAAGPEALPDVPLENGDHIVVPARPGFVSVAGAVVNNNSFLWRPGRTVGEYIKLAGLEEDAELSNMFILRADGTIKHANDTRGLFGVGGLSAQALYPGDTVIVPNRLDYEAWGTALIRGLKDWSQIFSQFGLGAAAIKTLRQ